MASRFFGRVAAAGHVVAGSARRHVVMAAIVTALAAGAAGGGIGYTVFHSSSATSSSTRPSPSVSGRRAPGGRDRMVAVLIQLVANDTHQSRQQVLAQLREGRTLDEIAGMEASAVEQQALSRLQARLDAAVQAGKLTQAQEQRRLAGRRAALETILSTPGTQLRRLPGAPPVPTPSAAA